MDISVTRKFPAEQYGNIDFHVSIKDIPIEILKSKDGVSTLYALLFLYVEEAHKRYIQLRMKYPATSEQISDTLKLISEEQEKTFAEFMQVYKDVFETNKKE
jgi:energy-converting hydrogenase A subunit M